LFAAALTLLSPRAAAVGVPALCAVAAVLFGRRRAEAVRRSLRLPQAAPRRARIRLALAVIVVALLTLAAAQPAVTHDHHLRVRRDVQVLFVVDVSRSMAASAMPRSATRLDRAVAAAVRLRAGVPGVAAGAATLTDRVLPNLFPVPDRSAFERVLTRGVSIGSPPPQAQAVRATSYDALQQIAGAGYFDPTARSHIVVVLTDGETDPVQTADVAVALAGYDVLFVRFWRGDEHVYDADGRVEPAYRPDPAGTTALGALATGLGGRVYQEDALNDAERRLQALVGTGPSIDSDAAVRTETPLAPYSAALALLAVVALVGLPTRLRPRVR
jgi:hypothetical protein